MRIYKVDEKIVVEMSSSDVIFNDGGRERSVIYMDASVMDNVDLIVDSDTTIISGLNPEQYNELYSTMLGKINEIRKRDTTYNIGGLGF